MLYAGLDLSRKRLDFHLLDSEGATVEVGAPGVLCVYDAGIELPGWARGPGHPTIDVSNPNAPLLGFGISEVRSLPPERGVESGSWAVTPACCLPPLAAGH